jgi:hypothetical protein
MIAREKPFTSRIPIVIGVVIAPIDVLTFWRPIATIRLRPVTVTEGSSLVKSNPLRRRQP